MQLGSWGSAIRVSEELGFHFCRWNLVSFPYCESGAWLETSAVPGVRSLEPSKPTPPAVEEDCWRRPETMAPPATFHVGLF